MSPIICYTWTVLRGKDQVELGGISDREGGSGLSYILWMLILVFLDWCILIC